MVEEKEKKGPILKQKADQEQPARCSA